MQNKKERYDYKGRMRVSFMRLFCLTEDVAEKNQKDTS